MLTFENIKHFIGIVTYDGINKAAERLFISPSSLSRSVQIIETELGHKLFDRIGRTLQLNAQGREFYDKSLGLISQYDQLFKVESHLEKELVGNFTIGASHFLCKSLLAKKISALAKKYKNATFGVVSLDSSTLVKKIHAGELDMGISFSPKDSDIIESQTIHSGQLYLCGRKKHPLSGAPFTEVKKTISDYPAIMHRPSDSIERCDNHPAFKQYNLRPDIQIFWDSDFFALETLHQDDYWSLMPDLIIDSDSRIVKFNHPVNWNAPYEIKLFWNKKKSQENLKKAFL